MLRKLIAHIRGQFVGYIALVLAISGGTAMALQGRNTVFSDDIAPDEVRGADVDESTLSLGRAWSRYLDCCVDMAEGGFDPPVAGVNDVLKQKLPAGAYLLMFKGSVNVDVSDGVICRLYAQGLQDEALAYDPIDDEAETFLSGNQTMFMTTVHESDKEFVVHVACIDRGGAASADFFKLQAIELSEIVSHETSQS